MTQFNDALIGHTGFVGGNLAAQHRFQHLFRSTNIGEIENKSFDLLACAGVPAAKWIANQDPEADWKNITGLMAKLETVRAKTFVLISTIDIYPKPVNVDESTLPEVNSHHAYGKHRFLLEQFVQKHFPNRLIIRLPALFGQGLKKNIIYDFLNNNQLEKIDSEAVFQFYSLEHLWADCKKALVKGIEVLNVATEPLKVATIAKECFGREFHNPATGPHAFYDFKSQHDSEWDGSHGYLYSSKQVLAELKQFVKRQKS